ncbi:hypothetical protein V8C42DRAFT_154523 [Trichoderma barbatum]
MSTLNNDGNYISHNQDKQPVTYTNSHPTLNPSESPNRHHVITAATESQQYDAHVSLQQQPLSSFDTAHHGWDASNVSTAKCDLCHRQRCGTLQKCRICKLSICQECCAAGRLQNDRRHAIDAAAVDWDAPPNLRKRKRQDLPLEGGDNTPLGAKKQKAGVRRGRGCGRKVVDETRGVLASSAVMVPDEAAATPNREVSWQSAARLREHDHVDAMEPRLSVTPASYYLSAGQAQHRDAISPNYAARYELERASSSYRRLPAIEEAGDEDSNEDYWMSLDGEGYPAASAPGLSSRRPVTPANNVSQAAPSRPVLPPITPLLRDSHIQHRHSAETFHSSSDILNRLDHLLHHQPPVTNESWPSHEHIASLGTNLANAARANYASNPPKPLDHCLRDELQAAWTSHAFIAQDPDTGRRYRWLLAAAYFASACLGLEPQRNAAREWLCAEERKMRDMGHEPTKTAAVLDFLQEVGIWYLRQVQR